MIDPNLLTSSARDRQNLYLNALRTLPKVRIILGKYQEREVSCRATCRETYRVPEEKKTDVNIAVHLIDDVLKKRIQSCVIVSGDSDVEPAVKWIHDNEPGVKITVYIPTLDPTNEPRGNSFYKSIGVTARFLPLDRIPTFQLPDKVPAQHSGNHFQKPASWV